MSIISQETWDNMPNEEKERLREYYDIYSNEVENDSEISVANGQKHLLEGLFGKENLQPEPKVPKTWDDVKETYPETYGNENIELFPYHEFAWNIKLIRKNIATLKIAKLIELGYGGIVTEEEWRDDELIKFGIKWNYKANDWVYHNTKTTKEFITFHTPEQREEFMSYPENIKLVEQYNLL